MKPVIKEIIDLFASIGVTEVGVINELGRFRVLDQLISSNSEAREWGMTADTLYAMAQESTRDQFGEMPYDLAAFKKVYGPSFRVEIMDVISETGYYDGVVAGHQWRTPFEEILQFHKKSEGIILFAYIEEYAALAEEVLQTFPADRLLFYTASPSCLELFRRLYPLAPVTDEWPEDVIFDHMVVATTGMFQPPVITMEQLGARVGNISEGGTAHFFIPLSAVQDQRNMNRVAFQYMLLQPNLSDIYEWTPLQTYQLVYGNDAVKKVKVGIRELQGEEGYRTTEFIQLPHEVLGAMDTFSVVQYGLSLYGLPMTMDSHAPTMGEDGTMSEDFRLPPYIQRLMKSYGGMSLEVVKEEGNLELVMRAHEGHAEHADLDEEAIKAIIESDVEEERPHWSFTNPVGAYIWYTYFRTPEGRSMLKALGQMALTPLGVLQLMGSCRRAVLDEEGLASFVNRFQEGHTLYEESKREIESRWESTLHELGDSIVVRTESKGE